MKITLPAYLAPLCIGFLTLSARAQGDESPITQAPLPNLSTLMEDGGPLIYLLIAMSVLALALVVYFLFALSAKQIAPIAFVRDVTDKLQSGDYESARELCAKKKNPVAVIVASALTYMDRVDEPDADMLREVVEGEGVRQATQLQTRISYLLDIGVIAPMVGLLGTVVGMLRAFGSIATDLARAQPIEMAKGVSQALVTTAAGLVVAIPAMIFYAYFRGRVSKLTANLELVATDVVTTLVHRRKG